MVSCRISKDTFGLLFRSKFANSIEGAPKFEATGLLEVFTLEKDLDFFPSFFIC
jgi:hypothetical protein